MFISQLNILLKNIIRQLQDQQNGQRIVNMEHTKNMVILTSDILTLMQMESDVHLNHGKY